MKISYVTIGNASNIHSWSGLEYFISKTLENYVGEVSYIGDLKVKNKLGLRQKQIFYRLIGQRYDAVRNLHFANECSKQIQPLISTDTDVVFSPGSVATSLLNIPQHKVIYSDATFAGLLNFYVKDLCSATIRKGHYLEQKALESASLAIYSSEYAAKSAIENYDVDPQKVKVVPFGANINREYSLEEIEAIIDARSKRDCELLFLGVDWKRKGGELAVKVAKKLNMMGVKTRLHLVGLKKIPPGPLPDYVINHGFLSKSSAIEEEKIIKLMSKCHFLLLPTRAEAYGLAFCEANSMGLPAVATNVGGIPTIIKDHVNGMTFSLEEDESEYATFIASVFTNPSDYKKLALSSYNEYEKRLNWKVAGKSIARLLEGLR